MKRVLMLNYEFPPLGGGAGNATYYLLKEFSKDKDLSIDLVTSSTGSFREEQFADNITIHFLDIGKDNNLHNQSNLDLLKYSYKAYRYSKQLVRERNKGVVKNEADNGFDIIHTFFGIPCGYIAMRLKKKYKTPYIVSLRGSDVPFYSQRFYWLDKLAFRRISKRVWQGARKVVANSEGLKQLALQASPDQEIQVIPNGIDTEEFHPRSGDRGVSDEVTIVSTGRLIERKGYRYLIEAVAGMDDASVVLVGDGPLKSQLEDLAENLGVNVEFVGKKPHSQLIKYLTKADIFCLPSLNEGMSNSILEAMACGLPIITTNTGGSEELIDSNGFMVEKESSEAIREAIGKYLEDRNLLHQHSKKSRQLAERMSWSGVADRYRGVY